MTRARRILVAGTALGLILTAGAPRSALDGRGVATRSGTSAEGANTAPIAQVESASVAVSGMLTPAARQTIRAGDDDGQYLVIVLRARDRRKCEDLGRQLRETLREADGGFRAVLVTEDSAAEGYLAFARREHLKATVVSFPLDSLMQDRPRPPTPAVLVEVDANGLVEGIAHPARFANVRTRSFAAEMHALLTSDATKTRVARGRESL
jgi:hypothetical protein